MEQDLIRIKELLIKYIYLIIDNYPSCNKEKLLQRISDNDMMVDYNTSNTVSFNVKNGVLLLPKVTYQIFPLLKQNENYGTKGNSGRNPIEYLDTNTTYIDYIKHVIEGGLSEYEYFEESLLHEAMHICGSFGGTPLEEGINELKTRELAQKHNIKIAAYGYSKEVEIAKRLQEIIGKEIMDELTFIPKHKRKEYLTNKVGIEIANLYELLSDKMIEKSANYYNSVLEVNDPFEKARLYEEIDYSEVHQILDDYSKEKSR